MAQDGLFCVGQKAVIDKDGEVLVLFDISGKLDLPGGKIKEDGKDFSGELKREVREETGIEVEIGQPFSTGYFEYDGERQSNFGKKVYLVLFKCKYVSGEVRLSDEHSAFRWVNKDTYEELASDGRDDYCRALEKYFSAG